MVIFSILALRNLRSRRVRWIQPVSLQTTQTMEKEKQKSKRNVQLIRLSLLQVLVFSLLNAPWTAFAMFVLMAKMETFGFFNYILMNSFLNGIGIAFLYIYGSVGATLIDVLCCSICFRLHSLYIRSLQTHFGLNAN